MFFKKIKMIFVSLDQVKDQIAHFGGLNLKKILFMFEFFLWRLFFEVIRRYLQIVSENVKF